MKEEVFNSLSHANLKELTALRKQMDLIYEENLDLLDIVSSQSDYHYKTEDGRFYFIVEDIKVTGNNLTAGVTFRPQSLQSNTTGSSSCELKMVPNTFKIWISYVRKYNEAIKEYQSPYYDEIEKEFEDIFGNTDSEDFGSEDLQRMIKYLDFIEVRLGMEDQSNPEIPKLLSYTQEFKNEVEGLPRDEIKKKFIFISTGVRKHAKKFMKDFLEVAYKQMLKSILNGGIDFLDGGFHHLLHH
jgi:hypothetical protein